ncbi:hypothetical protein HY024_03940 [Candidatus Curtissbacteria bacterium]|nr:hypothetical protein [Candidatus Curtissbacteria bacterium]
MPERGRRPRQVVVMAAREKPYQGGPEVVLTVGEGFAFIDGNIRDGTIIVASLVRVIDHRKYRLDFAEKVGRWGQPFRGSKALRVEDTYSIGGTRCRFSASFDGDGGLKFVFPQVDVQIQKVSSDGELLLPR